MEINLKTLLDWIMKGIIFIIVITILAGTGAFLYTKYFVSPTYRASVKFRASSSATALSGANLNYFKSVAPEHIQLLKDVHEFYSDVAEELLDTTQRHYSAKKIKGMISISDVVEDTSVFYVYVTASTASEAKEVADAVAVCAPLRIEKLTEGVDTLTVISDPELPTSPASPNIRRNTIYGLLGGFLLSVFLVVVKELLDNNIKTSEEITEQFGLPVLGVVPDFSNQEKEGK